MLRVIILDRKYYSYIKKRVLYDTIRPYIICKIRITLTYFKPTNSTHQPTIIDETFTKNIFRESETTLSECNPFNPKIRSSVYVFKRSDFLGSHLVLIINREVSNLWFINIPQD